MSDIEKVILNVIKDINDSIPDDITVNLLTNGYIDSFEIANIVAEIEEKFNIEVEPEDIIPENFDSIEKMAKLVSKLK